MSEKNSLTHAEIVRQRRTKENAHRMARARQEATRPMPVVTTREAMQKRKRVQNARRRFQIALPVPRANVRAISIPRPRLGWRLLSFFLTVLFGAGIYYAINLPQLRVAEAQVVGNQLVTQAEVNAVLGIAGQPVFLLTPVDLENRLRLNYPELASVRVTVDLPNRVVVSVAERQPIIRWEQSGGYTWVDAEGVAFRPRGEMSELISVAAASAPPAGGGAADPLNPAPYLSIQMVQAVKALALHVPPGAVILYDSLFGFGWDDARGWRVYFGTRADDVELKVRVYEAMVASLTQRGIRPALINVTYPEAPYYRLER